MRTAPTGVVNGQTLKQWLDAGNNVSFRTDLLKVTLIDGSTIYRWTTGNDHISSGGNTYFSAMGDSAPLVKRGLYSQSSRLKVDTLDLTLIGGAFLIGGKSLPLLGVQGYFDGARVQIDHLIGPDLVTALGFGPIPSFFEGRVASVEPVGPELRLRLKSELESLNILLPKFVLQPACGNAVYDATCGLNRATFTDNGTASGSPTTTSVPSTTAAIIARPNNYYNLGVLKFTSGANNGLRRAVKAFSVSGGIATFALALPFPVAPAAADTFTVYPGCNRTRAACANNNSAVGPAFNNLAQFRGFPHMPNPESGG